MAEEKNTLFSSVYNSFLSKITDDMYMELSKEDTLALQGELLESALPYFEFPRKDISDYNMEEQTFNVPLSKEEINIIAIYMMVEWFSRQLASVELTRMKYSGSDFKFTSQANHMSKLLVLKKDYERLGFHMQRLYKRRRKDSEGRIRSTMGDIMKPVGKEV